MKKRLISIMVVLALMILPILAGCGRDGGAARTSKKGSSEVECNWTLKVDQTIPVTKDGLTVNYTLVLIAQKMGGKDVMGTYEGAAYLGIELDAQQMSNGLVNFTGGFKVDAFANNMTFDVVTYDVDKYMYYGLKEGDPPLAPLVKYESMALVTPDMQGSGVINPHVTDIQGQLEGGFDATVTSTTPIPMLITINSGKVEVNIPMLNISHDFEGMLLGDPIGDKEEDDTYEEIKAKIDELIDDYEKQKEAPSDDNGLTGGNGGGMGDIMGKVGVNLPLPESFPVEDFPLIEGYNIINVHENAEKTSVRIMYATEATIEEILEFYEESVIKKLNTDPIDIDGGVMYMGSFGDYRNVMFMVMEDQSKTYDRIVYLEVLKK